MGKITMLYIFLGFIYGYMWTAICGYPEHVLDWIFFGVGWYLVNYIHGEIVDFFEVV